MFARVAEASMSLDIGTLFVIATCVAALLGCFLLFTWMQDRIKALAWWGTAYLIGGFSGALWRLGGIVSSPAPQYLADVLLFIAVGMIWSAARLFHGRQVRWVAMCFGGIVWLGACLIPAFNTTPGAHIVLGSLIVASYTFLAAAELWRERRKSLLRSWPASLVPMLHGAIFLLPMVLASFDLRSVGSGWVAVFAIEVVLYVVGAAFIVLALAKDRTASRYKKAAATDPLTGLLNRRGFFEAAAAIMKANTPRRQPVSVLAFDLDDFKSINDRFGHRTGDMVLDLFGAVARRTMRADDVIGRLGGEEFAAIICGGVDDASVAAERVRTAFERAASGQIPATVSIGIACGEPKASIDAVIARADAALYRAKRNGRNRVEADRAVVTALTVRPAHGRGEVRAVGRLEPVRALAVPILRKTMPR